MLRADDAVAWQVLLGGKTVTVMRECANDRKIESLFPHTHAGALLRSCTTRTSDNSAETEPESSVGTTYVHDDHS